VFPVNITLDACGFIVMLIVLYSVLFETSEKSIRNSILRTIVITVMVGILINISYITLQVYYPDSLITNIVKILAYLPSNIWLGSLICYLISFLREKKVGSWVLAKIAGITLVANCFIIVLIGITKSNFIIALFLQLIISFVYVIVCCKNRIILGNHLFIALFMNMFIPFVAFVLDFFIPGLFTEYFAESISVVICCVMVQHQEIQENNITLQVTNSELEDHIHQIISLNNSLNEHNNIIQSMGKIYFSTYYIDLENDSFEELSSKNNIRSEIGNVGRAQESLYIMCDKLIHPDYAEKIREFVDLSTINERLKNKDFVTCDYIGATSGWSQMYLIAGDRDENRNLRHVFSATRIIHEEKEREFQQNKALTDALEQAKKANISKTAFLSRMSHDIRTPLNGIIGLIELNERHPEDRSLVDQNREKAKIAANHLLSLINDVLELTKMDDDTVKLSYEAFDISELRQEILTIASLRATESGITFDIEKDEYKFDEEYVFGSPLHVRQVLLNVCGNAIKYNKPHGKISYKTTCISHDDTNVTYMVTISDTGIGMSKEFIEHIYEPFSQEHSDARSVYQGTGLGMSIVKSLMDKMGGEIRVESEVGVGTKFELIFPFKVAKKEDLPVKVSVDNFDISGIKILLVEDNELNMEIAEAILVDNGAVVTKAFDGQEAVNIYQSHDSGTFDVILMDLMMPVLDGFGATSAIRSTDKRDAKTIPIIAMTANAFAEDAKKCIDAGMNAHVSKPINISDLFNKIAIVMKR